MKLRPFAPEYADAYNRFLHRFDEALVYYGLRYKAFLEDLLDCTADYWLAFDGENIAGILPLMTKDGLFDKVINSLPYYGSNGGVIAYTIGWTRVIHRPSSTPASV